ncbi:MAG TPA: pyruvate formate lyase family protein [Desulfitobacteriaceae bacterium]|nr:pyruvate formate lyase family protein [Desulfitobacteriaceae bacterium]
MGNPKAVRELKKPKNLGLISPIEKENLERCIVEVEDPIGARNWNLAPQIVEQIKNLEFGTRLNALREEIRTTLPVLKIKERAKPVMESLKETEGEDQQIRMAKSLAKVLREIPVVIRDNELIVGSLTKEVRGALWFPEIVDWLADEIDTISTREWNPFILSDEDKQYYLEEVHPYFKDRSSLSRIYKTLPEDIREKYSAGLWSNGIAQEGHIGHIIVIDRMRLLRGIGWYKARALELMEKADKCSPHYPDRLCFWKSAVIICDAIKDFAHRYAEEARNMAKLEKDAKRKAELEKIAEACDRVPWNAPRDFHECLQSAWFYHLIYYLETNMTAQSPGRIDQKFYSWFKKDVIEDKTLSLDEAKELLGCYWLKIAATQKVNSEMESKWRTGNLMFQNICLGGTDKEGKSAVNELSYLGLKIEQFCHLDQPNVGIWVHPNVPDDFMEEAAKVVRTGGGKPQFIAVQNKVEHFMKVGGFPKEIAMDYDSVCCNFMWYQYYPHYEHSADIVPGKAMELALNDGVERRSGRQIGPKTGDPRQFKSIDEVYDAWDAQNKYAIESTCIHANVIYKVWQEWLRVPYTSLFIGTCMTDGRDITDGGSGGCAMTNASSIGLVNVINSIAALEKVVFDDKKATMAEVIDALDKNFEGYEDLQKLLYDAPKYGNDDDFVDKWIRVIQYEISDEYNKYPLRFGRNRKHLGYLHLSAGVPFGGMTGALPDGRYAGMPFAEGGNSPYQGTDTHGPLGSMRTLAKWDYENMLTCIYNQRYHPTAITTDEDVKKFAQLIRTYLCYMGENGKGGQHVQCNVVSSETLKAAQKDPSKFRDLTIRVAGYTAYFCEISKDLQDDIIARTEFEEVNC